MAECIICLQPFTPESGMFQACPCSKTHLECLQRWLIESPVQCPTCHYKYKFIHEYIPVKKESFISNVKKFLIMKNILLIKFILCLSGVIFTGFHFAINKNIFIDMWFSWLYSICLTMGGVIIYYYSDTLCIKYPIFVYIIVNSIIVFALSLLASLRDNMPAILVGLFVTLTIIPMSGFLISRINKEIYNIKIQVYNQVSTKLLIVAPYSQHQV